MSVLRRNPYGNIVARNKDWLVVIALWAVILAICAGIGEATKNVPTVAESANTLCTDHRGVKTLDPGSFWHMQANAICRDGTAVQP